MRKLIFLIALSISSYFYLQAQTKEEKAVSNYGQAFAKEYQPSDLYKIEIIRPEKKGFALQVATFSNYPNVIKYVTSLQGRWFKNILMKLDVNNEKQPIYKILIGPFPDKNVAKSYKKYAKKQGIDGFIIALEENTRPTPIALTPTESSKKAPVLIKSANKKPVAIQKGEASYYHKKFHGRTTAYGEKYNMNAFTAAHWTLPYNTELKVCRLDNNKCVNVRVNDRGPNPKKAKAKDGKPRLIDLSMAAAKAIDLVNAGVAQVSIEVLN